MSRISQPFLLTLFSSVALLTAGCGNSAAQRQDNGVAVVADTDAPMTLSPQNMATDIQDQALMQRVERLEGRVDSLDGDMSEARPKLEKLDSMERHFRLLSLELDRINKTYGVAPVPAAKSVVVPKPATVVAKPPASVEKAKPAPVKKSAGPLTVEKVRVGEQAGGKTRIVLDTTAPAKLSYDIDNTEKILVIELPGAAWAAQTTQALKNGGLVSSYKAENDGKNSRMIVQLKHAAKVAATSRLAPSGEAGDRVFLDLVSQ